MSWRREHWREFDEMLINAIQKYPYIYDVTLKEFRDEDVRANAWQALALELGTNGKLFLLMLPTLIHCLSFINFFSDMITQNVFPN